MLAAARRTQSRLLILAQALEQELLEPPVGIGPLLLEAAVEHGVPQLDSSLPPPDTRVSPRGAEFERREAGCVALRKKYTLPSNLRNASLASTRCCCCETLR